MEIVYSIYCYSCHCEKCAGRDVYVGKSKYGTEQRHKSHIRVANRIIEGRVNKKDLKFDYFLAKHGVESCRVRTLGIFSSEDEMNDAEMMFINERETFIEFGGMNFDRGGKGGRRSNVYKPSDTTKKKQSESMKEHYKCKPFTQDAKAHLSYAQIEAHMRDDTLGKRKNAKSWKTIFERRNNASYDENFVKMMREKARLGGIAFLEKLKDEKFKDEFSKKISVSVSAWCDENPDLVKERTRKAIASRLLNVTWLENVRNASRKVTKEERSERIKKGWETRKKNNLKNALQIEECKEHDYTTSSIVA